MMSKTRILLKLYRIVIFDPLELNKLWAKNMVKEKPHRILLVHKDHKFIDGKVHPLPAIPCSSLPSLTTLPALLASQC